MASATVLDSYDIIDVPAPNVPAPSAARLTRKRLPLHRRGHQPPPINALAAPAAVAVEEEEERQTTRWWLLAAGVVAAATLFALLSSNSLSYAIHSALVG